MYSLYLLRSSERDLDAIPKLLRDRIESAILLLAEDPRPQSVRKLRAGIGWRIRVGDYRVVYEIDDRAREVTVVKTRHRRDVYRGDP